MLALLPLLLLPSPQGATDPHVPDPHVTGRAVRAGGEPVAGAALLVHAFDREGDHHTLERVPTGGDGRFALRLPESWQGRTTAAFFLKTLDVRHGGWAVRACAPYEDPDSGPCGLGTVELAVPRTWARGKVEGRRPIPDDVSLDTYDERTVTLWPETRFPAAGAEDWRRIDGGSEVQRDPRRDGGYELRAAMVRVTCKGDDTFEVFGFPPPGATRLQVHSRYHLPRDPVPFEVGADDLVVTVQRGGTVRARITVPAAEGAPDAGHLGLVPRLLPDDGRERGGLRPPGAPADEGKWDRTAPRTWRSPPRAGAGTREYEWPAVPPGRYRLELWTWGASEPHHTVPGIEVRDRQLVDDRRLTSLEIDTALVTIVAANADGDRLEGRDGAVVVTSGPGDPRQAYPLHDGRAHVLTGPGPLTLEVRVPGFLPGRIPDVTDDADERTLRLERSAPTRVRRPEEPDLPADAVLELVLEPLDPPRLRLPPRHELDHVPDPLQVIPFGELRSLDVYVTAPGRHRIALQVRDTRYGDHAPLTGSERLVDLPREDGLTVRVPDPGLRSALEALGLDQ